MKTVRLAIGLFFFVAAILAVALSKGSFDALFMVPFAAALGVIAGIFLHPFISAPFGNALASLFYPDRGVVREQFSRVHALMAQQQFAAAELELRRMLEERPELVEGQVLLANLLHGELGRADEALTVAIAALDASEWQPEHERLAMLAVDILLDAERRDEAVALLEKQARRAGQRPAAARLTERLRNV